MQKIVDMLMVCAITVGMVAVVASFVLLALSAHALGVGAVGYVFSWGMAIALGMAFAALLIDMWSKLLR